MICFGFLRIFREKLQKRKTEKSGQNGLLRRNIGNPHCGVDLCHSMGCLAAVRPRGQNGTPRVRHDVAKLRRGEGLRRSSATLRRSYCTP